jgi:hypothetical protein
MKEGLARDLSGLSGKEQGLNFDEPRGALITLMYNRMTQEAAQKRRFRKN